MTGKKDIRILYEDRYIIVCVKPAGIASQGSRGFQQDLTDLLKLHIQQETGIKGEPYLGIVHRLDQPVGGIMVYAKEPQSAAALSAQAASDGMKKRYYAVLEKCPAEQEGVLKDYLLRDGRTNTSCVVPETRRMEKDVKPAELSYQILNECAVSMMRGTGAEQMSARTSQQNGKKLYLAEIELKTGRHHQIRVQFAHIGCPLYGDAKYNPDTAGRALALFSHYLAFTHPQTKKRMQFEQKPDAGIFTEFFA